MEIFMAMKHVKQDWEVRTGGTGEYVSPKTLQI